MSVITKGRTFVNGEQLTAAKLNDLVDDAVFDDTTAVDNSTTRVNSSGAITVKPQGITSNELATSALEAAYPVGSIYMNASDSTDPSILLGFGTWVAFGAGRVPVGIDSSDANFNTAEETGGVKTVTLTAAQSGLPAHSHSASAASSYTDGGNGNFPNGGVALYNDTSQTWNNITINNKAAQNASQAHSNLQPYIVVHMWKRTA